MFNFLNKDNDARSERRNLSNISYLRKREKGTWMLFWYKQINFENVLLFLLDILAI